MEKFLLRKLLGCQKLNIIHQQKINGAMLVAKGLVALFADGGNQLVGELFTGGIEHLFIRIMLHKIVANRLEQMGFAETAAAVDK